MCFGFCLPTSYTAIPLKEQPEVKPPSVKEPQVIELPTSKRAKTEWRDIPLVAKYELIKQIGKGGFAEIWLAQSRESREVVALKVVQLSNTDLEPEEVVTLLAEAKFLRTLDCPYLLKCRETSATDDWLILTLEYLPGGEMLEHIHKVTKYTEAEAAKLFAQVVSAISYLHNLNLIHRDIKPENIMFTSPVEECEAEGRPLRVKVIDLGMAALYDPKKEIRGCIGTPGFVAPELWNDGPHTPAGDIYSLGVVLFIMLTGRKPHGGLDIRMMTYCNKSIRDAPGLKDGRFLALSAPARALLLSMLADDPRDRPTCMEVLRHPFITAVDSNAEAHREMGEDVRRRMRDLMKIRRIHGLRYALRVQKPQGADHHAFLRVLDQRRLKLKGEAGSFGRPSDSQGAFARPSEAQGPFGRLSDGGGAFGRVSHSGAPAFARSSLATSYGCPPLVLAAPPRDFHVAGTSSCTSAGSPGSVTMTRSTSTVAVVASAAAASPPGASSTFTSPFATASVPAGGASHSNASRVRLPPVSAFHSAPRGGFVSGLATIASVSCETGSGPDALSHDLGIPVPGSLAARPRLPAAGHDAARQHHGAVNMDPMALVNALPRLRHCSSVDGLAVGEDGERLDGGSPAASVALVEQALMSKCMSANQYTLELMGHAASLQQVLDQVLVEQDDPAVMRADAAARHHNHPLPQRGGLMPGPQTRPTGGHQAAAPPAAAHPVAP